MHEFVEKVRNIIDKHSLFRHDSPIIVAVSGGADSICLLAVLVELGYTCMAAHCNFHLRGEESNRDMRHVENIAKQFEVDLYIKEFDVKKHVEHTGLSIEMACRELRYNWFYDLLDRNRAQAIAVGHHREDQAETFFLNLLRGSGLTGLAGMRHRFNHIIRPLLDVTRSEIENYLIDKGLHWINDSSNSSDNFSRNRIRNHILPLFEELFPGATDSIIRSMSFLRENEILYKRAAREFGERYVDDTTGEIDLCRMIETEPDASLILFEILKPEGFNRTQTDDMIKSATRSGGIFRSGTTHVREVDHGLLRAPRACKPIEPDAYEVSLTSDILRPVHIEIKRLPIEEFKPERNPSVIYLDEGALDAPHVWQIRRWRRGDRMIPYGMKKSKLLSDIFADARMSMAQKEAVWLLTCDNEIIWAIGLRASSQFTIKPSTCSFMRLTLM